MSSATSIEGQGRLKPDTTDSTFRPWHFFVLGALIAATVGVLMSRPSSPAGLILLSLAIGAAALAGLGFYRTLWPLVASDFVEGAEMVGRRTRAAVEREKMLVLRAIKELEFDRAMGKVSERDFQEMAGRLRARAVGLMRQLDSDASGYRELIEQELRQRLGPGATEQGSPRVVRETASRSDTAHSREAVGQAFRPASKGAEWAAAEVELSCRSCGTVNDADARFCKHCGARLAG